MGPKSYGVCVVSPGMFVGNPTAEAVRIESAHAIVHLDHVGMGNRVTRTLNPGGGRLWMTIPFSSDAGGNQGVGSAIVLGHENWTAH